MQLQFHRYLSASQFAEELKKTHAYESEYVGDGLLEELEETGLVIPRLRLRLPEPVARRAWMEEHDYAKNPFGPLEPDGPRWDAAVDLLNRLSRWNSSIFKPAVHPFDDPEPQQIEFIERPVQGPFVRWADRRVDVSNETHPKLLDNGNMESYYSTWQALLAAEVANAGFHFRLNLADDDVWNATQQRLQDNHVPSSRHRTQFDPVRAVRTFSDHAPTLDAVVWHAEESERIFLVIAKEKTGRFSLDREEHAAYQQQVKKLAGAATQRFGITLENATALTRYLCERWSHWTRCGRPLIADAYKAVLGKTVVLIREAFGSSFDELKQVTGITLDAVWPDWMAEQKAKVVLSLKKWTSEKNAVTETELSGFVDFIEREGLESFFWRLQSFERHCFNGNSFALGGMHSDLQGMAVAVEHIAVALGGTRSQLHEKFKKLWTDEASVSELLKDNRWGQFARVTVKSDPWSLVKPEIERLRATSQFGEIAADLIVASRIRLGAHNPVEEDDPFELEQLFLCLMRAAVTSYAHLSRRNGAGHSAPT
jgi:hypothetical protein